MALTGAWGEQASSDIQDPCYNFAALASMVQGKLDEPSNVALFTESSRRDYDAFNRTAYINVHMELAHRNVYGSAYHIEVGVGYSHMERGKPKVFTYVCDRSLGSLNGGVTHYRGPLRAPIRGQDFTIKRRKRSDAFSGYQCYERGRAIGPLLGVGYDAMDSVRCGFYYDDIFGGTTQIPPTIMKLYFAVADGKKRGWAIMSGGSVGRPGRWEDRPPSWGNSPGCIPGDQIFARGFVSHDPALCFYYGQTKSELHFALNRSRPVRNAGDRPC